MSRSKSHFSDTQILSRIKKGYGQGEGSQYTPWLKVQDVPSSGRSHRVYSHKTNRVHHLLSDLELTVFLLLEWQSDVIDIREQFPLKLEDTLQIADVKQIKHPSMRGVNQVMSSDFLVNCNNKLFNQFAIQVKSAEALNDKRTLEKLEIERSYWAQKSIPWFIFTDKEVNPIVKQNIEWLYAAKSSLEPALGLLEQLPILKKHFNEKPQQLIVSLCKSLDIAYHQEPGQSLQDIRVLIANGFIKFDLYQKFNTCKCINLYICDVSDIQGLQYVAS